MQQPCLLIDHLDHAALLPPVFPKQCHASLADCEPRGAQLSQLSRLCASAALHLEKVRLLSSVSVVSVHLMSDKGQTQLTALSRVGSQS